MPATLSFICANDLKFDMARGNKGYPECESCVNREFDPFQCDSCEDGSNYESEEEQDFLTIHDLIDMLKEAA